MGRMTIAKFTAQYLRDHDEVSVNWGGFGLQDDICLALYNEGLSKIWDEHPLDRHISLLNRLEGSDLFCKHFIRVSRCHVGLNGEMLVRIFYLKDQCPHCKDTN